MFGYTNMPFGLSSAPSCFLKVMVSVLADILGVAIYLDNLYTGQLLRSKMIYSTQLSLTLNTDKCVFPVPAIIWWPLGGITPLQSNVNAIQASCSGRLPPGHDRLFLGSFLRTLPQLHCVSYSIRTSHGCGLRHALTLCMPSKRNLLPLQYWLILTSPAPPS